MTRNLLIAQFLLLTLNMTVFGQDADNQASLAFSVVQKLPYGSSFGVMQDLRSKDDNSTLKKSLTELSMSYKINKSFGLGTDFRYSVYPDKISDRTGVYVTTRIKTGPFTHSYRLKYQREDVNGHDLEERIRHKYGLAYKWNWGLKPFLEYEAFTDPQEPQWAIAKHRINLGASKKLSKTNSLKVYYRIQDEMDDDEVDRIKMIGLRFDVELKARKSKKSDESEEPELTPEP